MALTEKKSSQFCKTHVFSCFIDRLRPWAVVEEQIFVVRGRVTVHGTVYEKRCEESVAFETLLHIIKELVQEERKGGLGEEGIITLLPRRQVPNGLSSSDHSVILLPAQLTKLTLCCWETLES